MEPLTLGTHENDNTNKRDPEFLRTFPQKSVSSPNSTGLASAMGLFDKIKESLGGDDKPKSFEVTFVEQKMGMTISAGKNNEAVVTGGE